MVEALITVLEQEIRLITPPGPGASMDEWVEHRKHLDELPADDEGVISAKEFADRTISGERDNGSSQLSEEDWKEIDAILAAP
jgi:hypothetical protein